MVGELPAEIIRVDPEFSKVLSTKLSEILNCSPDSFPGSQPVSFETKHLLDIEREDYFVCEKSDGVRYLLFFFHTTSGPKSFLYNRKKHWYYVPHLLFPVNKFNNKFLKDTLMDGELVLDIEANKKTWRYLIFDLMVVNGSPIIGRSFSSRLGMLRQDVIPGFYSRLKTLPHDSRPPFAIELKKMERSYGLHLVFDQIPNLKHKSDGVIWTPVKFPYTFGTCEKLLKWKPPELNTVDFRISAKYSKEHKPIYSVEVLSNGVTYKFYDHFQPEPVLATEWKENLPDGKIAEFRYDPELDVTIVEPGYAPTIRKGGWRFVSFREDKDTANDEAVVKKILISIKDGVTKEQLLTCIDRFRAAWKAREKGIPMPPPLTKEAFSNLSLSTQQLLPTTPAVNTPSSASGSGGSYFREKGDEGYSSSVANSRNNSISDEHTNTSKRKSSISSITKALKECIGPIAETVEEEGEEEEDEERKEDDSETGREGKRFKSIIEEKETTSPIEIKKKREDAIIIKELKPVTIAKEPIIPFSPPLCRKLSSVSEPTIVKKQHISKMEENSTSKTVSPTQSQSPTSIRASTKRTASAPTIHVPPTTAIIKQERKVSPINQQPQQPLNIVQPSITINSNSTSKKGITIATAHSHDLQQTQSLSSSPIASSSVTGSYTMTTKNHQPRSKSIPHLPIKKQPADFANTDYSTMTTTKKHKTTSSSSIHNLLNTNTEPTHTSSSTGSSSNAEGMNRANNSSNGRGYGLSNILQRGTEDQQQQQQGYGFKQIQAQPQPPQAYAQQQPMPQSQPSMTLAQMQQQQQHAMERQVQQTHRQRALHVQQDQQKPVQFINFHAEAQQQQQMQQQQQPPHTSNGNHGNNSSNKHVMIIRSESNSSSNSGGHQGIPPSQPQLPPSQPQPQPLHSSSTTSTTHSRKWKQQQQPPPPHLYNRAASDGPLPQQKQPMYPQPSQHHPHYYGYDNQSLPPQQQHYHPSNNYYNNESVPPYNNRLPPQQQPQPQYPNPTNSTAATATAASPPRKNSQKSKLDFILN